MKIIQTLWLAENEAAPIKNNCGWLSPEYHWLSWILSVHQLRKFYDHVELYANKAGKQVLIDQLKLPYTKVHELDGGDLNIPPGAWALSKIITYTLQEEPFLHVDGDVFIWKPFDDELLTAGLIAQNEETGFDEYPESLEKVQQNFKHIPPIFSLKPESDLFPRSTYNAGIIGGSDVSFFKKYGEQAIAFVMNNKEQFKTTEDSSQQCMLFEQWLFSALIKKANKKVSTLLKGVIRDNEYPGMSDFLNASSKGYLHLMGITKRNRHALKQLMSKVRKEYPDNYYAVLRLCRENNIDLDFKVYHLSELNPQHHSCDYFQKVLNTYTPLNIITENNKWIHYYGKDAYIFNQTESFHKLYPEELNKQRLSVNSDVEIADDNTPDDVQQHLKIYDTFSLENIDLPLDQLEMIILDTLLNKPKNTVEILESIKHHFDETDYLENKDVLRNLVIDKVKKLMHQGALIWDDFLSNRKN